LQNQIARAVAGEIRAKLTPQESVQLSRERPVNPIAYEAYLKGRFRWNKRTESDMKAGIDYFNRAIEADPQYALAYVGLADSYNILGSWAFTTLPAGEARKMALLHANKALAIDEGLGEAHASLANAKVLFDWDWEGGEAEFKRAMELNPNYANAHHWYAELLLNLGCPSPKLRPD
jgi:tetratricopeptide (TPR) repeat protein